MRFVHFLLLTCLAATSGCTAVLVAGGKDVSELATRADVRREFGTPLASGQTNGEVYDEFHTRRRIAKGHDWEQAYWMVTALSLGLSEPFVFPLEFSRLCSGLLFGQDVRFTYHPSGHIRSVTVDGYSVLHRSHPPVEEPAQPTTPHP